MHREPEPGSASGPGEPASVDPEAAEIPIAINLLQGLWGGEIPSGETAGEPASAGATAPAAGPDCDGREASGIEALQAALKGYRY